MIAEASAKGFGAFWEALIEPDARAAIRLTFTIAAIVVPLNAAFGFAAAWAVAKFAFAGKNLLITLIDLPFSVSPVVSGLVFVLLFGSQGWFGSVARRASRQDHLRRARHRRWRRLFVTFPFVARELIPLMQLPGNAEEEAALTLGASGFKTFLTVTLPNAKWALLAGVLLCNARAMGEFGAVSVVSGHIRGATNTIPLQVEILYNEYSIAAAFSLASLLALLALVTLVAQVPSEGACRASSLSACRRLRPRTARDRGRRGVQRFRRRAPCSTASIL